MNAAEEVEAILQRLVETNPTGFAVGLHVSFTTSKFLFQTYRKDWMEEYSRRGLIMIDPTVRWGLTNVGAVRWSDLAPLDDAGVFDAARGYGLAYGVTISTEAEGTKSFGSFASSEREFTDAEIASFLASVDRMHHLTTDAALPADLATRLRRIAISSTHG